MQWIQSVFLTVAGFFGYTPPVEPVITPPIVIEEKLVAQTETEANTAEVGQIDSADQATEPPTEQLLKEDTNKPETMTGNAKPVTPTPEVTTPDIKTMLVAGGCFWCVEADLEKTPGVLSAVSGYAGGTTANPTYQNYGSGGHREVVEVTYDANQISFEEILIVTMKTTDPTDDDGTFADRGNKYSAAFYYETPEQKAIIENLIAEVNEQGPYQTSLAIDVEPRPTFYAAEDNHQDYYKGTLTQLKYQYYRNASGRNDFIEKHWGSDTSPTLPWRTTSTNETSMNTTYPWQTYQKPDADTLKAQLDPLVYKVTQEDGTERAGTSPLDKNYERGIYVDVLSGAPLFSSKDKYDSGTGWPSFVAPITPDAVTEHEDRKLFTVRTETRSRYGDNHLGHVFADGPADRGGLRYCMNGAALRFVPEAEMTAAGYQDFLQYL